MFLFTIINLFFIVVITFSFVACNEKSNQEEAVNQTDKPSDADLMAFKVYHHMVYMVTTSKQAGGTNKLLHTTELPSEGTDPVVSPALDHLYTKAVIDLTEGMVVVEIPKVEDIRYYSIHITDQEHYTIYDEIHPVGKYIIVRKGMELEVPEGATVIESPGDYPHLFIRVQLKNEADKPNVLPIRTIEIKFTKIYFLKLKYKT